MPSTDSDSVEVKKKMDKMLEVGIIQKSNSLYANPIVIVNEKNSEHIWKECEFRFWISDVGQIKAFKSVRGFERAKIEIFCEKWYLSWFFPK